MKRLVAFLTSKLEDKKIENKVKRVEIALKSAELNFKSQKDDNEIKMDELLEKFKDSETTVESIIDELSNTIELIEEAERGLKRVSDIKEFLFKEIE